MSLEMRGLVSINREQLEGSWHWQFVCCLNLSEEDQRRKPEDLNEMIFERLKSLGHVLKWIIREEQPSMAPVFVAASRSDKENSENIIPLCDRLILSLIETVIRNKGFATCGGIIESAHNMQVFQSAVELETEKQLSRAIARDRREKKLGKKREKAASS